ncbi:MAG: hypothetical protein ACJAY2_001713 [Pseudomonadales bacterium]|jgi:hypothetical protein
MVLSLSLLVGIAHADASKLYFGVGISDGRVDIANDSDESIGAVNASFGLQLRDFVSIELAVGSASDQSNSILRDPQVTYQAAMLRLGYRWKRGGAYIIGGQALLDIDEQFITSDGGMVYGFGINLFGNETTALNFHVLDFDDGAFRTATIGFQHYFGELR